LRRRGGGRRKRAEDCDNVLLLEREAHAAEARRKFFDVECGSRGRGRWLAVVVVDEVVVIVFLVGGRVHL